MARIKVQVPGGNFKSIQVGGSSVVQQTIVQQVPQNAVVPSSSGGGGSGITALTGDVTASGSGSVVATIAANAVTYAKIQKTSAGAVLIGNPTGSAADVEEITLGTNLSFAGTVLNASGGSSGYPAQLGYGGI